MDESAADEEIVLRGRALARKLQAYLPENIEETDVEDKIYLTKMEEIDRIQEEVLEKIDKLLYKFPQTGRRQYHEELSQKVLSDVRDYKSRVNAKVIQVKRNMSSISSASTAPLTQRGESDLKRREVEAMERANTRAEEESDKTRRMEREKSVMKAKSIYDNLEADIPKLMDKITLIDVDDWSDKDDNSISKGMRKLDKWEAELKEITTMQRKLVDQKNVYNILENEVRCEHVEEEVRELEMAFNEVKEKLEAEDEERGLYSLEKPKTATITLPTFSGKDFEDFSKFKLDMEDGFKTNRISKKEQIHKLRECLKGQARKLIPDSNVTDVGTAWEILQKSYGNPIKIIKQRKEALLKLGEMPSGRVKGQDDLRPQIAWFLDITTFLKELIELGKKNSEYSDVAFSKEFAGQLRRVFPNNFRRKLRKCEGDDGLELFENLLNKIEEFREDAQEDQQDIDITKPIVSPPSRFSGNDQRHGPAAICQTVHDESDEETNENEDILIFSSALVAFKPPRRDEKCRVCRQLDTEGDTDDLYDNHLHNYPSGCPRYIQMDIKERNRICYEAKICMKCHDPEYNFKPDDTDHQVICKQTSYTCRSRNCDLHMWVCHRHKNDNREALEKFKNKYERDHKLNFGLFVTIGSLHGHINLGQAAVKRKKNMLRTQHGPAGVYKKPRKNTSDDKIKVLEQKEDSIEKVSKSGKGGTKKTSKKFTRSPKRISTKEASTILKRKLSTEGGADIVLKPVPKGRAQFMIGQTKGRSRPLTTLYDSGCYALLLKEGVQRELGKSVLKTKGPFHVNGVGNTTVTVNDEWTTSIPLIDGSRQIVEGWTVNEVTGTLPQVDLTEAVTELKDDDKNNLKLQGMFVEQLTGGQIDILLGTMYNAIFPIPVHSLPSGLTIYELQVCSHDEKVNSVIGGPHESFERIAEQTGGLYNLVFTNLIQSLENYRNFGAPSLPKSLVMSVEDEQFSKDHKEWEMEEQDEIEDMDGNLDDIFEAIEEDGQNGKKGENSEAAIICSGCGENPGDKEMVNEVACIHATVDNEENVNALKKIQHSPSEGMQIEYRCPRCRSCNDCRRSFETERVSVREEAEDQMIHDSINIDWEKNEIVCSLPLRGKEHEFLSNNREIALKILDQQCYKYHKDTETRNVIVKAFEKLIRNKQMVPWTDLTDEEKKAVEAKNLDHYIPWRVVFKPSPSTPARPVFDASMNTKVKDGQGGRSLNDLVVKGRVTTLNLLKMILRFQTGAAAVQGDLKQFYASIKLVTEQWNLQRVLFRKDLDPQNEVMEGIIRTLIWGVKSVSAQSEASIIQLAEFIKQKSPKLYDFLLNCRFCDDLGNSAATVEELKELTKEADELFAQVGLECKGWSFSGEDPLPELTEDGQLVSIGGMKWHPLMDTLEMLIPRLHFSRKLRGRLIAGTQIFEGTMEQLDSFVPKKLTRRIIFSKNHSIFDLPGKLAPILAILKVDLREAVEQTVGWDDPVPEELRTKWIKNFWMLEKLRGMKFQRAIMPEGAVSMKMNLIIAVDVSEKSVKMAGAWGRFRLQSGLFSCQLVLGRSLLADKDSTIPKLELDSLTVGSNMGWILRQALGDWVESYILIGDSSIAISWVTSTEKRLSLFHRNRCVQIRRGTDLEHLYHCATEFNPSDLGTRPHLVKLTDVGPNSVWEKGLPWMREEIDDAVEKGILTPAKNLRLNVEQEDDYKRGFVHERTPEILTPGHIVTIATVRVEKVQERQEFSNYLVPPNKYRFEKLVRILSLVRRFIVKCSKGRYLDIQGATKFQMFTVTEKREQKVNCLALMLEEPVIEDYSFFSNFSIGVKKPGLQFKGKHYVHLTKDDISWSLEYLFRKGTQEVLKFNKPEFVRKIAILKDGILFARSRILDSQRFKAAGGLEDLDIVKEFGIKMMTPVLDRYSPLSYKIGDYIHRKVSNHAGYENCLRESLNHCFIIHGLNLFKELGEDCTRCLKMRKRFLDIVEGPTPDESLVIAPPFYIAMCDIYGPCHIYVPGHAMKTRHRAVVEAKCYVLVVVCPVTKLVNLQVLEAKSADGVIDGVTRLCCEVGVPSTMLVDQDSGILKALKEVEIDIRDLDLLFHKEKGMKFKTCPVSGHNYHGLVERKIRTVQECLDKHEVNGMRLHATGLQTFCKLIENEMNNLPFGYSFGRDADNSPLLKLIFPNMLRVGRNNSRALDGPVKMPNGPGELMKKVETAYKMFYELWNVTMIPKLMRMHKWFDGKAELQTGDIVYFRKQENELSSKWTVGKVAEIVKSKDGKVRRCTVQYQNASENVARFTDRAARSLIKLFNIDDASWQEDMDLVEKLIKEVTDEKEEVVKKYTMNFTSGLKVRLKAVGDYDSPKRQVGVQHNMKAMMSKLKMTRGCKNCCCYPHCVMNEHGKSVGPPDFHVELCKEFMFPGLLDRAWDEFDEYKVDLFDSMPVDQDKLVSILHAINTDLGQDESGDEEEDQSFASANTPDARSQSNKS